MSDSSRRRLGPVTLTALVVANMIGAGVFTTSGFSLADLGSAGRVMLAWIVGGAIAMCGALSYGALSRHLDQSGGEYLFLSRLVHPMAGFIAGWISLLGGFTGAIAFAALALEDYVGVGLFASWPRGTIALATLALATLLHSVRVRPGAVAQNVAVGCKVALVVGFITLALWHGRPEDAPPLIGAGPFSLSAFAATLVWISLSYSGFNAAVYVAGEAAEGPREVPRALWRGTLLVTVLYLGLNAVFVLLPPAEAVSGRADVAAAAAEAIGGPSLAHLARGLIALALFTSVSSMMMAGPRVYAQMADDGVFPRNLSFRGEVPRRAILLQAGLAGLVILFSELKDLLSYLGFTLSISAALTVASLFLLRRRAGSERVPVVGYPLVPLLYVGATLGLAVLAAQHAPMQLAAFGATVVSGGLLYPLARR